MTQRRRLRSSPCERLCTLCTVHSGLHLHLRVADIARGAECSGRCGLQHRGQRPAHSLHGIRKNRSRVFPNPDTHGRRSAPKRGSPVHRAAEGPDQRPVRAPERPVRGSGNPGHTLAWGCASEPEKAAPEETRRDPADHAGVPGVPHDHQTHGDPVAVSRPAFHRDRRDSLPASG